MKFKTELHCHTGDVSNCGQETAEYIVSRYLEAGYTSLVVANHMSYYTFVGSRKKYSNFLEKTQKSDCKKLFKKFVYLPKNVIYLMKSPIIYIM